ncbi:MFS transporter [Vitreoscilla sp. C1]|uniref:MFS transporter n=1 Tax=Vitreoscilla sp. (strain C1) TaxID=96942 RepID=UPI00148ECC63|nr:MFS transporter [Vitreoscilla sp. C1]AUZ04738.2 MFS transporter [Vitreoscilla sp. C1]
MLKKSWLSLDMVALFASVSIVGLSTGLTIPLVTLLLNQKGLASDWLGIAAAMPAIGMLLASLISHRLAKKVSNKILLLCASGMSAISILALGFTDSLTWLLAWRFVMGFGCGLLVVLGETWVNVISTPRWRGRVVAAYATMYTICQVAGPSILAWFGSNAVWPIWIAFALNAMGFALLLPSKCDMNLDTDSHHSLSPWKVIAYVPAIILAIFTFAFFDTAMLALLPLYGLQYGLSEQIAVLAVSVLFIGDAVFQMPLGWLADKLGAARVHVGSAAVFVVSLLCLPWVMGSGLLWVMLVIMGASAGGLYTLGLIRVGGHFQGQDLIAANAAIGIVWGIGSLAGPLLSNALMGAVGSNGLLYGLVALTLGFLWCSRLPQSKAIALQEV